MSEQPVTGRVVFSGPQFTSDKVAAAIRELRDALDAQAERIKELEGALRGIVEIEDSPTMAVIGWTAAINRAREALK